MPLYWKVPNLIRLIFSLRHTLHPSLLLSPSLSFSLSFPFSLCFVLYSAHCRLWNKLGYDRSAGDQHRTLFLTVIAVLLGNITKFLLWLTDKFLKRLLKQKTLFSSFPLEDLEMKEAHLVTRWRFWIQHISNNSFNRFLQSRKWMNEWITHSTMFRCYSTLNVQHVN